MAYLEVSSKLGKRIKITKSYWEYIVRVKHREMRNLEEAVVKVLDSLFEIRRSRRDPSVYLYYGHHGDKSLCIVAKHLNEEGFIVTAYVAHGVGRGEVVWRSS